MADTTDLYALIAANLGINPLLLVILLVAIGIWTLVWKGIALWKAGKAGHKIWFIAFIITSPPFISELGILEMLYIFVFSKIKLESPKKQVKAKKRK